MRNDQMHVWRRWAVGAIMVASMGLVGGCGPNDRVRDDYMGKPTPPEYNPIEHDKYGNAIIPESRRHEDSDTAARRDADE